MPTEIAVSSISVGSFQKPCDGGGLFQLSSISSSVVRALLHNKTHPFYL